MAKLEREVGKKNSEAKLSRRRVLLGAGGIAAVGVAGVSSLLGLGGPDGDESGSGGAGKSTETQTTTQTAQTKTQAETFANGQLAKVAEFATVPSEFSYKFVGRVKNISGGTLSYVQIQVSFMVGNTQIATAMDNTTNLVPGAVWPFEAIAFKMDMQRPTGAYFGFTASGF